MPALLLRWIIWGVVEILVTLVLASIAPILINSAWVWVGFLLWLGIIFMWLGSGLYVIATLGAAYAVRRLVLRQFPEYSDRSWCDFVGLSVPQVERSIAAWQTLQNDRDFQAIGLSPLDFIKGDGL